MPEYVDTRSFSRAGSDAGAKQRIDAAQRLGGFIRYSSDSNTGEIHPLDSSKFDVYRDDGLELTVSKEDVIRVIADCTSIVYSDISRSKFVADSDASRRDL